MEKLKMHTQDGSDVNIRKIAELFPNCVTEQIGEDGHTHQAIDFDKLRQELSKEIVEGAQERYQFTWPDKKKAIRLANAPSSMTLRPCREESVDFDNTQNLYIEGDNLEVLKLLRENYLGKVKVIYIDPPYNTGNDFVYEDDFSQATTGYVANSGQIDQEGNRLFQNTESNGRFHTDWLNMMYSRLKVGRDLLASDGVLFVSIDDNEQTNVKKLCEEIFGENNKVAELVVIRAEGGGLAKQVIKGHDYLFVYAKDITKFTPLGRPKDIRGKIVEVDGEKYWIQEDWLRKEFGKYGNCHYEEVLEFKGQKTYDEINQGLKNGKYMLIPKSNGMHIVGKLRNIKEDASKFYSVLKHLSANGIKDLEELKLSEYFSYPKPVSLLCEIISGATFFTAKKGDIILDFFSGSATTAHAVMKINAEDEGNRKFIMVQLPELMEPGTPAYKAGYKNICEVGKERIRRAGKLIVSKLNESHQSEGLFAQGDSKSSLDIGFRVLKLDSSNMEDVYYRPEDSSEATLFEDNVKPDRTGEDLLFQVMLECNLPLSAKIKTEKIAGKEVFSVNNGYLIACFDEDVNEKVITEVAKRKPYYFIMRDKSLSSDNVADNFEQIFQAYSKETIRRIL